MRLLRFNDSKQFYDTAKDYLLQYEAHHCLPLAIAETLVKHPQRYNCQPYLAVVESAGEVVATAIRTPPYKLVLSRIEDLGAVELIAKDLYSQQTELPGFSGLIEETLAFAQTWQNITDQACQLGMQMRIHQLQTVQDIPRSQGHLRNATDEYRSLLLKWYKEFDTEAMGAMGGTQESIERAIDHHLQQNTAYIWENEVPVTMIFCAGATANSKRIGPVYTPPEYRKQGYATTCVAELTEKLLQAGSKFCCLFTDLANPTSNKIYRKIGYLPVADWNDYNIPL
ncbi:MAG: GNAT family N-acetyltransferase [Calothrix sp. MO_192.B10]|nr:GNAT family N-acetyltransferase [Calothrix sp. MO_192.B10]